MSQVERRNAGKGVSETEHGGYRAHNSQTPGQRKCDENKIVNPVFNQGTPDHIE